MQRLPGKSVVFLMCVFSLFYLTLFSPLPSMAAEAVLPGSMAEKVPKPNAFFDADKMGDMSEYNPAIVVSPTGDTIKIAIVGAFSGPAQVNGQFYWNMVQWVVYDYNKRGGIMVDGKKKLIEVIKADHQSRPDACRKICERMALQEKVHFFWGTDGSHLMKIINEVANRHKIITLNATTLSDDIQDATNFTRYSFQAAFTTEQAARAFAYFYGQMRKKEKKFYILNQDYSFGREFAKAFKAGLKEYYPESQIVGEDYHKLFLTDFAPYLEKIKASGAEVIFTGDWSPDAGNLLKQARQMGIMLPMANIYITSPDYLNEVGIEGTKGLQNLNTFVVDNPQFKGQKGYVEIYNMWKHLWQTKWTPPYNTITYKVYSTSWATWTSMTYWLMSVIERAQSTDPEKIIKIWEGDTFRFVNGKIVKMRACDHKLIQDLAIAEFVPPEGQKVAHNIPPYHWYDGTSNVGPVAIVPAAKILPWMDQKLDRCKGKNGWGE